MTAAGLDAPWETTTPLMHRSCNDAVIQLSSRSCYAVLEVVEIIHACFVHLVLQLFPTHVSQLDLNPANLEAAVQAEWIMAFLFLPKWHKSMTLQSRHHYIAPYKSWWDILQFSVTRIVRMIRAKKNTKSCLNLSRLRPKYCRFLIFGHITCRKSGFTRWCPCVCLFICLAVHLFVCRLWKLWIAYNFLSHQHVVTYAC